MDEGFVAARSPSVVTIEVGDEVVVVDEAQHAFHALNATGALVWSFLDGVSTLGAICSDIAEAYGVPDEVVLADAIPVVENLVERGSAFDAQVGPADRAHEPTGAARSGSVAQEGPEPAATSTFLVRVGDAVVAVGSNDRAVLDRLARVLAPIVVAGGPDPTGTVFLLTGAAPGRLLALHYLYVDGRRVLRTPDLGRLLRATMRHLEGFGPRPEGLLLHGRLVVGRPGAVIVQAAFGPQAELPERRMAKGGWQQLDIPELVVDPRTLDVVVAAPTLPVDPVARAEIDAIWPHQRAEAPAVAGRHRLLAVLLVGYNPQDPHRPDGPAERLVRQVPLVLGHRPLRAIDIARLAEVSARLPIRWSPTADASDRARLFEELSRSSGRR